MWKKMFPLLAVFSTVASASELESGLFLPTDTVGQHIFSSNPAFYLPRATTVSYANVWRNTAVKQTRSLQDGMETLSSTRTRESRSAGFMARAGSVTGLGIQYVHDEFQDETTSSRFDAYRKSPAVEKETRNGGTARFVAELGQGVRLGVAYEYLLLHAKTLGSFEASRDDVLRGKGTLGTLTFGGYLNSGAMGFGLGYQMPPRGMFEVEGASKVTTESGYVLATTHYEFTKEMRIGLGLQKWLQERDERSARLVRDGKASAFLRGLHPESVLQPQEALALGLDAPVSQYIAVRGAVTLERWAFTGDDAALLSMYNSSKTVNSARARMGVDILHKEATVFVGGDYTTRKFNGNPIGHRTKEYSLFGHFGLVF